ncbi:Uncharacterized oxidoreductase C30D10.05c [Durusdinium trenchii]|uniref:Uncharacterized oxidoreductase C30D10.05c n=1 Tax=Durusdinium trenchii TaxID=1381693 RepID=A0ABP0HPD4_9DINO
MKGFLLVTGASSGIGRALAVHFSKKQFGVVAVARRAEELEKTSKLGVAENFKLVVADVATEEGRTAVADAVQAFCPKKLDAVIQNAGLMGNIKKVTEVSYDSWRKTFAVNVDAPLFLTQKLVPEMTSGGRILHISTGAAHSAMDGWSAYCTSKAAFFMLYQSLKLELAPLGIVVGSVSPGVIDSNMQAEIRNASKDDMSMVENFKGLKENMYSGPDPKKPHRPPANGLDTPENVAHFIDFLLHDTSAEEFSAGEWDIRDPSNFTRWIKSLAVAPCLPRKLATRLDAAAENIRRREEGGDRAEEGTAAVGAAAPRVRSKAKMKGFLVITGASSGIGRALAVHFSKKQFGVVAVARRAEELEKTSKLGVAENFKLVVADVATEEGRTAVAEAVQAFCPKKLDAVIQNAGILGCVKKVTEVSYDSWRKAFAVNVDAPLFLTQKLVPEMTSGGRILHISSGAAHSAYAGWSPYCASKAAFFMLYQSLKLELAPLGIVVGSVKPGIVDSEMQDEVRTADKEDMALVDTFKAFKDNMYGGDANKPHVPPSDGLDTPENVAHFIDFLLHDTSADEFSAAEWDIRDASNHNRWIK